MPTNKYGKAEIEEYLSPSMSEKRNFSFRIMLLLNMEKLMAIID